MGWRVRPRGPPLLRAPPAPPSVRLGPRAKGPAGLLPVRPLSLSVEEARRPRQHSVAAVPDRPGRAAVCGPGVAGGLRLGNAGGSPEIVLAALVVRARACARARSAGYLNTRMLVILNENGQVSLPTGTPSAAGTIAPLRPPPPPRPPPLLPSPLPAPSPLQAYTLVANHPPLSPRAASLAAAWASRPLSPPFSLTSSFLPAVVNPRPRPRPVGRPRLRTPPAPF